LPLANHQVQAATMEFGSSSRLPCGTNVIGLSWASASATPAAAAAAPASQSPANLLVVTTEARVQVHAADDARVLVSWITRPGLATAAARSTAGASTGAGTSGSGDASGSGGTSGSAAAGAFDLDAGGSRFTVAAVQHRVSRRFFAVMNARRLLGWHERELALEAALSNVRTCRCWLRFGAAPRWCRTLDSRGQRPCPQQGRSSFR
jgi:hypothetical protein